MSTPARETTAEREERKDGGSLARRERRDPGAGRVIAIA